MYDNVRYPTAQIHVNEVLYSENLEECTIYTLDIKFGVSIPTKIIRVRSSNIRIGLEAVTNDVRDNHFAEIEQGISPQQFNYYLEHLDNWIGEICDVPIYDSYIDYAHNIMKKYLSK